MTFQEPLKFGTGGFRAIMGDAPSQMNLLTIRRLTQGVAAHLKKTAAPSKAVVIGFDNRHNSQRFAEEAARVLIGNQIGVFLCKEARPTPFISFACRFLNARAAIIITASHNPKEYNGYKVYGEDGAQIVAPEDEKIMEEIANISSPSQISLGSLDLISWVGSSIDEAYLKTITSLPFLNSRKNPDLKICYSSLHGTGITLLPQALKQCGFHSPLLVESQCTMDGDFPSVASPNPESLPSLKEGTELLMKTKSDILFATDPDADRLGVVIRHHDKPRYLNGHELATLGTYYLCDHLSSQKKLSNKSTVVTTLVTTPLIDTICKAYGVKTDRVLTGFKYIGEKMRVWEKNPEHHSFLFGAEESCGYLVGTYCRDKDGISAALLFATIAADLKAKGKTCLDLLHEIYSRFSVFQEQSFSLDFPPGQEGVNLLNRLMKRLRMSPPLSLGDLPIADKTDYLQKVGSFPPANVLKWTLQEGTSLIIRPSGTEPKLKIYLSTSNPSSSNQIENIIEKCQAHLARVSQLMHSFITSEGL